MFYAMNTMYRVVVSHNPEHPNTYFIDICRDGFCSHDMIFEMQKKYYEDDNLQRVFNDSRGIMLVVSRDGNDCHLRYTWHNDYMARQHQALLRKKIDPQIMNVFDKMIEKGRMQTISVPLIEVETDLQRVCKEKGYAENLQEEEALKAAARAERLQQLKKIRHKYYLNQKYAAAPHLRLMLAQAERSGD